jgi:hypothetical protein
LQQVLGEAPLDAWVTFGDQSSRFVADNIYTANLWRTYNDDDEDDNTCYAVELIYSLAIWWPQDVVPYNIFGPNSNSFAHWLGAATFNPAPPPRAVGWYVYIPF